MNVAVVRKLRVIFVVSNNGWAISMPQYRQSTASRFYRCTLHPSASADVVHGGQPLDDEPALCQPHRSAHQRDKTF